MKKLILREAQWHLQDQSTIHGSLMSKSVLFPFSHWFATVPEIYLGAKLRISLWKTMCVYMCFAMTLALVGSSGTECSVVHKTVSGNEELSCSKCQ